MSVINKIKEGWKSIVDSLEREIPEIKEIKNNKTNLIVFITSLIIIIALPIMGVYLFTKLFEPIIKIFIKNFGAEAMGNFVSVLIICLIFFGAIAMSKIIRGAIFKEKQNWKPFFIYSITTTIFLTGVVFIHPIVGAPENEWTISDENNNVVGTIECGDYHNKLIYGHKISCKIKGIEVSEVSGKIRFELNDGSLSYENIYTYFLPPNNISHISLFFNAKDKEGDKIKLETGFHPKFYTEDEEKKRSKDFLTYFFGLLFLCLITIPQLVLKIMKEVNTSS